MKVERLLDTVKEAEKKVEDSVMMAGRKMEGSAMEAVRTMEDSVRKVVKKLEDSVMEAGVLHQSQRRRHRLAGAGTLSHWCLGSVDPGPENI